MRVFVTGATGVIGRRVVPRLLALGHSVTAMARSAESQDRLQQVGASPTTAGLFDQPALRAAMRGHQAVLNLATHIPPSSRAFLPGAWRENDRIRSIGSANIVEAALAAGAERFLQESFAPIYPDMGDEWIDETAPVRPARYNRSVLDAEAAPERFARSGRIGVVARFGLFYGPDSEFTRETIRLVRRGWAPAIGKPEGFMSSVSHDDAASAVVALLEGPSGVYNVVDDEPMRRRDLFGAIATLLGVAPPRLPPAWVARLAGSIGETLARSQRVSNRRLRETCGWRARYPSIREGWGADLAELGVGRHNR